MNKPGATGEPGALLSQLINNVLVHEVLCSLIKGTIDNFCQRGSIEPWWIYFDTTKYQMLVKYLCVVRCNRDAKFQQVGADVIFTYSYGDRKIPAIHGAPADFSSKT